jgi:hypothetical protein
VCYLGIGEELLVHFFAVLLSDLFIRSLVRKMFGDAWFGLVFLLIPYGVAVIDHSLFFRYFVMTIIMHATLTRCSTMPTGRLSVI